MRFPLALAVLLASAVAAQAQADGDNPLAAIPLDTLQSAASRPPFSATRRPPVPPPVPLATAPVAAPPPRADHLRLVGTLVGPAGGTALILDTGAGVTRRLAEGDAVDGWRVVRIEPDGVRIERGAQGVDLALFQPGAAPAMPVAPSAGRGPSQSVPLLPPATAANAPVVASPRGSSVPGGAAPPGTVAGTAAAKAAAESPFQLTFGAPPSATPRPAAAN